MKIFASLVLALLASQAFSQEKFTLVTGEEYPLVNISSDLISGGLSIPGNMRLCKFFILEGKPTPSTNVTFVIQIGDGSKNVSIIAAQRNTFITVKDESSNTEPTATFVQSRDEYDLVPYHWFIRISKADLDLCVPCIPDAF